MTRPLELNIKDIKLYAKQREDENWRFRAFLKGKGSSEVDQIVHKLYEEISRQIDCARCGNCCKSLTPSVSEEDVHRLSSAVDLSVDDFKRAYLEEKDQLDKTVYLKDIPCRFLDGKICSIYSDRPETCRSYPHLHKPEFTSRLFFFLYQYEVCPIVFNLYEQLKVNFNFHV